MVFRKILPAAVFLASALFGANAWAGTKTWVGGNGTNNTQRTDWARSGNWNPSGAPNFNDLAIIPVTANQPTVRADQNLGQLQVANGAVLTINAGFTLTCNGTATGGTLSSPVLQGPGTVAGAGTVRITGGLNNGLAISTSMTLPNLTFALSLPNNVFGIASGTTVTVNGALTVSSGSLQVGDAGGAASTLDVNGDLIMSATMGMRAANSLLRLSGNLNFSGNANNWTPGSSTVTLDNTADMTMTFSNANYQFNNLTITTGPRTGNQQVDGMLVTPNNGFTVNGNLAITRGQFRVGLFTVAVSGNVTSGASGVSQLDFTNTGIFSCRGNVDLGSVSQITTAVNGPFATILLNGTAAVQTFQLHAATNTAYFDLDQLQISNLLGVIVLDNPNADFTVNGQLTIDPGCKLTVRDVFDPESPLVMGANSTLRLENVVSADSTLVGSLFSLGAGSTVIYGATGINQTVYTQQANGTQIPYQNLTIDNSGGALADEQTTNTLNVLGNFTILGATSNFRSSANGMTVAKNFVDNGTFTHNGGTVTMTGTGSISGTAASLVFNNLTVNGGATLDVVTAARSFTTNNLLRVNNGILVTAGAATPITITALQNVTAGDGTGAAGSASLALRGTDTLAIAATRTFSVNPTDGRFTSLGNGPPYTNGPGGNPTLTRNGGAGNFLTDIGGQVDLMGLNFSFGGANGLYLHNATVQRLRNVRFTNILTGVGSRHLTLDTAIAQDVDCPGCMFDTVTAPVSGVPTQFNVWTQGAAHRLRFELRSASNTAGSIGGPGAGEAFDGDDDTNDDGRIASPETVTALHSGAIVQWVYTANIDMTGAIQGFPAVAFNWNTFSYTSTYMIMRQAPGVGDIIYVADANGDLKNYSYALSNLAGNITGPLFWDTEGLATQVLYFGTTTGLVYKLIDTGFGLSISGFPWDTPYSDPGLKYVSTMVMSDRTNLYFGGSDNLNPAAGNWGMYRVVNLTKAAPIGPISLNGAPITNAPSWADATLGRMIYQSTGVASGTSAIYRILTSTWSIDAQVNSTSAFTAPTNVPTDTCFVGEANGRMHAVAALGLPGIFPERNAFPFTINTSAVTGGAVWEPVKIARQPSLTGGRLLFGTANGDVYLLYLYPTNAAAWAAGTNYYIVSPAANAIQSMPLLQDGLFYISNSNGRLVVYDADNGAGPALMTTYNLFNNAAAGDVSRDAVTVSGRIYVGTSGARMYAITVPTDPTPTFP